FRLSGLVIGDWLLAGDEENDAGGGDPTDDAEHERNVFEQDVFGAAAFFSDVDEVEVAKDPIQHERDRKHHGVVRGKAFGGEGVEAVRHEGRRGDGGRHLVEKLGRVLVEDLAVVRGTVLQ